MENIVISWEDSSHIESSRECHVQLHSSPSNVETHRLLNSGSYLYSSPSNVETHRLLDSGSYLHHSRCEVGAREVVPKNVNVQRRKDKYYVDFSKFALTQSNNVNKPKEYSYQEWISSSQNIERVSLQVLKQTLKSNRLPVYGNKCVLISRIANHYRRIKSVIDIQRTFRGFMVRESENARGPAYKHISICNNETDFETMNPLDEIPREQFFSYRDDHGFIYGFNLRSLMSMFKRDRRLVNPYNREDVPFYALQNLFSLYKKTAILYPEMTR